MKRFMENAANLLNAAENAVQAGHEPSEMTILISPQGQIHMVADSDWPLDSLQAHHGAKTAYRVTRGKEKVCIDGREQNRSCHFESEDPKIVAHRLLAANAPFKILAESDVLAEPGTQHGGAAIHDDRLARYSVGLDQE